MPVGHRLVSEPFFRVVMGDQLGLCSDRLSKLPNQNAGNTLVVLLPRVSHQ